MMNDIKKNELNEQEMENVAGGAYTFEQFINAAGEAISDVVTPIGNAISDVAGIVVDIMDRDITRGG